MWWLLFKYIIITNITFIILLVYLYYVIYMIEGGV